MSLLHHRSPLPERATPPAAGGPLAPAQWPAATIPVHAEPDSAFSDFLAMLRRGWWVLALGGLLGGVAGYLYAARLTPLYRASASIEIQDLNENFLDLKEVASSAAAPPVSNDLQTQLRILQSHSLLARVLARITGTGAAPGDAPVEAAARQLQVRESRQSRIVDLAYEHPDPRYAARFVNELGQAYIDQTLEARLEISRNTSRWLDQQLNDLRAKLAESESRLQTYANRAGLLVTSRQERPDEEKLRQVQEHLSKAQENRAVKQEIGRAHV